MPVSIHKIKTALLEQARDNLMRARMELDRAYDCIRMGKAGATLNAYETASGAIDAASRFLYFAESCGLISSDEAGYLFRELEKLQMERFEFWHRCIWRAFVAGFPQCQEWIKVPRRIS